MKTRLQQEQGSFLITAAIASGILAILVFAYLEYITNEYTLNYQTRSWTQSMDLCEAGIELGMAELNFPYRLGGGAFQSTNGWSSAGTYGYTKSVTNFADQSGNYVGTLTVTATNVGALFPTVSCTATCPGATRGTNVTRTVAVILKQTINFPYAFALKQGMDVNNGTIDSFNSSNPSESSNGYYSAATRQFNGNVVTDGTSAQAVIVQNGAINGNVAVGSGGSLSMSGALVGATNSANQASTVGAAKGNGYLTTSFSQTFPDVTVPAPLSAGTAKGNINNATTLTTGDYTASGVTISQSSSPLIINGNVRLYVTGSISVQGSGFIQINSGDSLQMYCGGTVTLSGAGVVNNSSVAANDQWYGLPGSTAWTISGSSAFIGTVYAPEAGVTLQGGNAAAIGAIVANYATLTGNSNMHYDAALASSLGQNFYSVVAWKPLIFSGGSWILDSN